MGDHLHERLSLGSGDVVEVNSDTQCNIMLMSDSDYSSYRSARSFHYAGGFYKRFPVRLTPPHAGNWNVVLDLGGGHATIRHSIRVLSFG